MVKCKQRPKYLIQSRTEKLLGGTMTEYVKVEKIEDVTPEFLEVCEQVYDGFYANDDRIEWEGFLDRLERWGYDMGSSMESPAIKAIKKHIRKHKNL